MLLRMTSCEHFDFVNTAHAPKIRKTFSRSYCAGDLLQPDDVAFSVLVRGYGDTVPPQWAAISTVLARMQQQFGMKPGTCAPLSCSVLLRAID